MVRRGHAGERVQPGEGLVAAAYRHRMSRALDPQLHTHVVAANLARGPDGRFTALHGAELYRAAKTAGYLYQAHLRALVTERLGLEWGEVRNGAAELADVERPVVEHFSQRRHEMLRGAEEGGIGLGSTSAAEHAALATRKRKQYGLETHTWREEVRARAGEQGLGAGKVAELLRAGRERLPHGPAKRSAVDEQALAARLTSAEGLTERSNTFDERAVLQEFAAAAQAGALVGEVRGQAERFAEHPDVIATRGGEMTTAELVAVERRLIAAAVGRANEETGIIDPSLAERAIAAADRPLTAEQAAAVRGVTGSGHGVSVIQALAGTGKTYTAGVLRQVYESAGYTVLGVAPTGRAVRELAEEAGIPTRTLDRLLLDLEQLGDELPQNGVLILDEAGMAATRPTARLLEAAERARVKTVAIGDPGQLASVQAGGWLGAVVRTLGAQRLTEVMRQRDPTERRALGALHDSHPPALPRLDNGMRGTVRHVDPDRVVIDTDGGLVRELPAAYVAEHVEHAYSLTGHGMQGGTIESAIVVASPRDLTAGWSYTALSRARETTRLFVYDDDLERERSEFAPTDQPPTATRGELLDRVQRRMVERDDEDLAIEQLPGAGRAADPDLARAQTRAAYPPQEHAASRAEPTKRACEAIGRAERRLGREVTPAGDIDLGIGL